jgi:hypothetical protein
MNVEEETKQEGSGYAKSGEYKATGRTNFNPKSLANLKRITPETARENQAKSVKSKLANIAAREAMKLNAKLFQDVMSELPVLSSLDILRMAIHKAIAEDNYEDAARYAALLAEYEQPKLARIEQTNTNRTADLSDEELQEIINKEGL